MNKIHKKGQMALYAVSGMGVNMLNLMFGSYLCSALLVGGFGEAAVKNQTFAQKDLIIAAVWAVFVLVSKIIDGIIDIPMASFSDGLKTRWGRRRPALMIGFLPMVAAYLLFLIIPDPTGASVLNTIYYGVLLCIFYAFYTLTMVTYYATFTEIVDTMEQRNFISNVKSICDIAYFILGYVVVRAMLNSMNIRTVALIVLPLSLTMMIPMFMIKEPSNKGEAKSSEQVPGLVRSLSCTVKNKPFVLWMVVYSFMTFGVQLFLSGINEYFSFVGMSMILVMASSFAPVPLTLILFNKIQKKHSFGFAFRYVLLTYSFGMLMLFLTGLMEAGTLKTVLSVVSGLICSFSVGAFFSVAYSVPSELAAEEEKKTGVKNSAMYFAVQGLFAGIATGIATGVVLTALKGSEASHSTAMTFMTLIAAGGTLVSFLMTFILPKSIISLGSQETDKKEKEEKNED